MEQQLESINIDNVAYDPIGDSGIRQDAYLMEDGAARPPTICQEVVGNIRGVLFGFVRNVTPENRKTVFNKFRLHGLIFGASLAFVGLVLMTIECARMTYQPETKFVYSLDLTDWTIRNITVFSTDFDIDFASWFGEQKVIIDVADDDMIYSINVFWVVCRILASLALLAALIFSAIYWRNWARSRTVLLAGFVSQYLFCLLIFIVPISKLVVNVDFIIDCLPWKLFKQYMPDVADYFEHQFEKMAEYYLNATLAYAALKMLGPPTLGFIMGIAGGGFIAKSMYPSHFWCGWLIRLVPLTLAPIIALVGVCFIQILGDFVLASAIVILTLAIVLPLFFGKALTDSHETFADVKKAYRPVMLARLALFVVGGILLAIWYMLNFEVRLSILITSVLTMLISFMVSKVAGRLVFSDFVVGLVFAEEKRTRYE